MEAIMEDELDEEEEEEEGTVDMNEYMKKPAQAIIIKHG